MTMMNNLYCASIEGKGGKRYTCYFNIREVWNEDIIYRGNYHIFKKKAENIFVTGFDVTSIGGFGSFVHGEQTSSSNIDMVIELKKDKETIHRFLQLKRLLEKDIERKVDLGFRHSLKPIIKEKIKEQIIYV